jgi:hypothetical protein
MHSLIPPATTTGVLVNPDNAPQTAAERVITRIVGDVRKFLPRRRPHVTQIQRWGNRPAACG